jgi:plasmid stabilization system protein ParE
MKVRWTGRALRDLARIRDFLLPVNPAAAVRAVEALQAAVAVLADRPRIGAPIQEYQPLEVRRLIVGRYEIRYEIVDATIRILHLWHTRENR